MNIGQAAKASGVSAKLIRYYEQIGLIRSAGRTDGNYRSFGSREVNELHFIRRARALGFSVEEIRKLLALWRDPTLTSGDIKTAAEGHLADLEARIAEMQAMADVLRSLSVTTGPGDRPGAPSVPGPLDGEPERQPPSASRKRRPRRPE